MYLLDIKHSQGGKNNHTSNKSSRKLQAKISWILIFPVKGKVNFFYYT